MVVDPFILRQDNSSARNEYVMIMHNMHASA